MVDVLFVGKERMGIEMDREKQEKEVMEYLNEQLKLMNYSPNYKHQVRKVVRAIMRRYNLFDTEDLKRGE